MTDKIAMINRLTSSFNQRVKSRTLGKQLTFAACLLGILLCGACFGPGYSPPPPPPLTLDLKGIRTIEIKVTDSSDAQNLNPSELAEDIASKLNLWHSQTKVHAYTQNHGTSADALLSITILSASASPDEPPIPGQFARWSFHVHLSATLSKPDGQQIWHRTNAAFTSFSQSGTQDASAVWQLHGLKGYTTFVVSQEFVRAMLTDN